MSDPYDQASRYAAKLNPPNFFRRVLPRLDSNLVFQDWLDTRTLPFPGEPDRTCDTVARFRTRRGTKLIWVILAEFQSRPDPNVMDRLLEYLARLRRELRKQQGLDVQVFAVLINLTGPPQPNSVEFMLPGEPGIGLSFRPRIVTLSEQDAMVTLSEVSDDTALRCWLPWIPLMHGGGESNIIKEWKRVAEAETDVRLRSDYAGLAVVFAELANHGELWRSELEGWNVLESKIVNEWKREAAEAAAKTATLERGRADLLRVLRGKFRSAVSPAIRKLIESQSDLNTFDHWLDVAVEAQSVDEFRAVAKNNGSHR